VQSLQWKIITFWSSTKKLSNMWKPAVQVSSLIFRIRRVCRHSNETHAPIANPPNRAQLGSTPYHSSKLLPGPCSSVGMRWGTDIHKHTQMVVITIHLAWLCLMQNAFSVWTLLVGWQEEHPARKKTPLMKCWYDYLSGVRCKWLAYGPADASVTPSSLLQ